MAARLLVLLVVAAFMSARVALGEGAEVGEGCSDSPSVGELPKSSLAVQDEPATELKPLGLEGYCPVSLVLEKDWRLGDSQWEATHGRHRFVFAGPQQLAQFLARPDRYVPAVDGNDVVCAKESGERVAGSRLHGVTYGETILLFANEDNLEKFSKDPNTYYPLLNEAPRRGYSLDGFCPVTLVQAQVWKGGDLKWQAQHGGQTFLFASAENLERFVATPDLYAPAAAGNDVVIAREAGQIVPGKRSCGVFYRDKIFLFANENSLQKFSRTPEAYADTLLPEPPRRQDDQTGQAAKVESPTRPN